LSFKYID